LCSILFCSILLYSTLFYSILFNSIPFYSILLYSQFNLVQFNSILFNSIQLNSSPFDFSIFFLDFLSLSSLCPSPKDIFCRPRTYLGAHGCLYAEMEGSCTAAVHLRVTGQISKKMSRKNDKRRKTNIDSDTATGGDRERESGRQIDREKRVEAINQG
jgi:hypothetical protein